MLTLGRKSLTRRMPPQIRPTAASSVDILYANISGCHSGPQLAYQSPSCELEKCTPSSGRMQCHSLPSSPGAIGSNIILLVRPLRAFQVLAFERNSMWKEKDRSDPTPEKHKGKLYKWTWPFMESHWQIQHLQGSGLWWKLPNAVLSKSNVLGRGGRGGKRPHLLF